MRASSVASISIAVLLPGNACITNLAADYHHLAKSMNPGSWTSRSIASLFCRRVDHIPANNAVCVVFTLIACMQLLKTEIEEMRAHELKLRHMIVETAQRGAQETASQFRGEPDNGGPLSAPDLEQELEVIQGARQFAQGLVVSFSTP